MISIGLPAASARVLVRTIGALALAAAFGFNASAQDQGLDVVTYHNGEGRSGEFIVPGLTYGAAGGLHLDTGFSGRFSGQVYAEPLYWLPPGASNGLVVVATEENHVIALDATTGTMVWNRTLGPSVSASTLPCGNIGPVGITGTPAIEPQAGALFVVAQIEQAGQPTYQAFGLSLQDGSVLPGWPVDIGAGLARLGLTFQPNVQGERSALTFHQNRLYVPFGGRAGDCGSYRGWLVGLDLAPPGVAVAWQTRAERGGIWAVGGAIIDQGDVFVATGNTSGASTWSDGEAVIHLNRDLQPTTDPANYFAPADWQTLDAMDLDLGGTNPMRLGRDGRPYILQLGKDGNAYLLDRANLGGIGGQALVQQVSGGSIRGGLARWDTAPGTAFVAFSGAGSSCPGGQVGVTVLQITTGPPPAISTAWCGSLSGSGSPIVTTSDGTSDRIVWIVGAHGDGYLHGFRADTGAVVFGGGGSANHMPRVREFSTILAAQGRLYVPSDGRIYAFAP